MPANPPSKSRQRDDCVVLDRLKELETITAELKTRALIHQDVIESLAREIFCSWEWPDGPIDDIATLGSRKRHGRLN